MDDRNDRRRDRLSWAEIDKLRDKSHSRDRDPMQKQSSPAAMNAQKSYKAALERAFASGKLEELAKTLTRNSEDLRPPSSTSMPPPPGPGAGAAAAASPPAPAPAAAAPEAPVEAAALPPAPAAAPKDPDREQKLKLLAKIREAEGREPVSKAIDVYLARYPKLPDDFEILTKCLGHRSDDRVQSTLDQLNVMIDKDKPRRARTLAAQLRILEDTHGDPEIRAYAGRVRARL
jgi:hypothetical protein